jgi:hypothetical protein
MIDQGTLAEIIATYQKHGWILRRVLLSGPAKQAFGPTIDDVPVFDSTIDAAWFSRPPQSGGVAWEIRYLGDVPFALLENIDESSPSFEDDLSSVEARLNDAVTAKKSA